MEKEIFNPFRENNNYKDTITTYTKPFIHCTPKSRKTYFKRNTRKHNFLRFFMGRNS